MGIFQDLLAKFNETKQRVLGSKQTQQVQKLGTNPYQNIWDTYLQGAGLGGLMEDPTFTPD